MNITIVKPNNDLPKRRSLKIGTIFRYVTACNSKVTWLAVKNSCNQAQDLVLKSLLEEDKLTVQSVSQIIFDTCVEILGYLEISE